jgi:hypothetical protein
LSVIDEPSQEKSFVKERQINCANQCNTLKKVAPTRRSAFLSHRILMAAMPGIDARLLIEILHG